MLLRGTTVTQKPLLFTIEDAPIRLDEDVVALVGKKGSPLLIRNTIARGSKELGIFENDFLLDSKMNYIGVVIYDKGFKVKTKDEEVINLPDLATVTIEPNLRPCYKKIKNDIEWVHKKDRITIDDIVAKHEGKIFLKGKQDRRIPVAELKLYTGITVNEQSIAFGDTYQTGSVVLYNGIPSVKKLDGSIESIREET